jgi:hypothetical protein
VGRHCNIGSRFRAEEDFAGMVCTVRATLSEIMPHGECVLLTCGCITEIIRRHCSDVDASVATADIEEAIKISLGHDNVGDVVQVV